MSRTLVRLPTFVCGAVVAMWLTGCASPASTSRGAVRHSPLTQDDLVQSDLNRVATLAMRDNLEGLFLLADKLYRRNPQQWRKGSAAGAAQALAQLRQAVVQRQAWPALQGQRDIHALALAMSPTFAGDRVAAFIHALADMLIVAHGDRSQFFLLDSLDAQHLYNAARNVETAVWILAQRRDAQGQPLLHADVIEASGTRNLSFEREFGKIVARLDLVAEVMAEKYRRAAIGYVQGLVGAGLLQFLPVR